MEAGSFSSRCMCVLRELDELEQALEKNIYSEVEEECADVVIYLIVINHDLYGVNSCRIVDAIGTPYRSSATLTKPVRRQVTLAWNEWRRHESDAANICSRLRYALEDAVTLAIQLGVDIEAAVKAKTEKNALRGPTHGGKHPDT